MLDQNNMIIEDFGAQANLMIVNSVEKIIIGGFEDVLKEVGSATK